VDAHLYRTEEDLRVHLVSEDLSSLRAAVNSFLRWATMAAEVAEGVEQAPDHDYQMALDKGA
jgi:tRNA threonylcarbamoyladenosine modification (KEOPS) complex  Pcc1 subunit